MDFVSRPIIGALVAGGGKRCMPLDEEHRKSRTEKPHVRFDEGSLGYALAPTLPKRFPATPQPQGPPYLPDGRGFVAEYAFPVPRG